MKKFLIVLIFILTSLPSSALYFNVTQKNSNEVFYVKLKQKDFISGNVYMQNKNANNICNGFWFSLTPNTMGSSKNTSAFANVTCSQGQIFEMNWKSNLFGEAVDQYKNVYVINKIKRKEYKRNTKKRKIKNEQKL